MLERERNNGKRKGGHVMREEETMGKESKVML
jgi:hypothetical protein